MIALPSYFQAQQTGRVVLHHDQATSDPFSNLENLTSDATATAWWALEQLRGWAPGDFGAAKRSWTLLREAVRARQPLSDTFRQSARSLADALYRSEEAPEARQRVDAVADALLKAVELSDRVADLLAAETAIAKARGLSD